MARKKIYQYEKDVPENDLFISRSQKKRDSSTLQKIAAEIALLPTSNLVLLPLTEDLKLALAEYKRLSNKEAKRRHVQYMGKLMREAQDDAARDGTEDIMSVYLEKKPSFS